MTNGHDRAYWFAIQPGSIAAVKIAQPPLATFEPQFGVAGGNVRIVNDDRVVGVPANGGYGEQLPGLARLAGRRCPVLDHEHESSTQAFTGHGPNRGRQIPSRGPQNQVEEEVNEPNEGDAKRRHHPSSIQGLGEKGLVHSDASDATVNRALPKSSTSPGCTTDTRIRPPLTQVPLVLCRSTTRHAVPSSSILA